MQFHPKDLSELDDLTEEHLGFSALSDGLGFSKPAAKANAAKAGVPKAAAQPTSPPAAEEEDDFDAEPARDQELQRKAFSGTGAVAAGPARPAPAAYTAAYSAKAARPAAPAAYTATAAAPSRATSARPANNVLAEPAAPQALRVAAFLVDFAVIFAPMAAAWWVSFRAQSKAMFLQDPATPLMLFGVIFGAYFLLSESFGGQSLGKMLLGLRVVEDDKYQKPTGLSHAAVRLVLFVIGGACLGLGFLASFWDSKRRPWHDRYSGSIVRKKA